MSNTTITPRKFSKEQIEYRNNLFRRRKIPIEYKSKDPEPEEQEKEPVPDITIQPEDALLNNRETFYMRNCIFWIDEFENGRVRKDRFYSAIRSLQMHINKLIIKHQ